MTQDKCLKIVYCIPSLVLAGGGQRVLAIKTSYLVEYCNCEISIVVTDGKDNSPFFPLHPSIKIHQLDINYDIYYPLCQRFFSYIYKRMKHKRRLNKCLCNIRPDITVFMLRREISFFSSLTDGSLKIAENHFDKQHYLHIRNPHLTRFFPQFFWNWWEKKTICDLKQLNRFIVLTEEDKLLWSELPLSVVIPNPISFETKGLNSTVESKQVIAVGRYEWQKGFDMLIDAWKQVAEKYPDWILKIYGDGPMRSALENQVMINNLTASCKLEYPTQYIIEKYLESSLFVLSSRFEGFGLVIIEAMTCGLPVVSFSCPCGPKDIIKDKEDGLLIEPENVDYLAQNILYMIEHEEVRKQMGRQASINVQRYRMENIAPLWLKLFKTLLTENEQRK